MDLPKLDELIAEMQVRVDDPQKKLMVATIAADATRIASLALARPDQAEVELRHVKAQIANLTSAEATAVADVFTQWMARFVFALVSGALSA